MELSVTCEALAAGIMLQPSVQASEPIRPTQYTMAHGGSHTVVQVCKSVRCRKSNMLSAIFLPPETCGHCRSPSGKPNVILLALCLTELLCRSCSSVRGSGVLWRPEAECRDHRLAYSQQLHAEHGNGMASWRSLSPPLDASIRLLPSQCNGFHMYASGCWFGMMQDVQHHAHAFS